MDKQAVVVPDASRGRTRSVRRWRGLSAADRALAVCAAVGWFSACSADPSSTTAGFGDGGGTNSLSTSTGRATGTETGSGSGAALDSSSTSSSDSDGSGESGLQVCTWEDNGELELSFLWVANSLESTVSKIDTQTLVEQGRYRTHPGDGNPSRTSVNLNGDAVIANRNGGVAMFWADVEDCVESNGMPGIQTSKAGGEILPWEQDECMAWYRDLSCESNRPVAWTRGEFSTQECAYVGADVWTACDDEILLLNGATGEIELRVDAGPAFFYGGAADANGDFWALDRGAAPGELVRVTLADATVTRWPGPEILAYGITVGPKGRPWLCAGGSVARFEVETGSYAVKHPTGAGPSPIALGGCMTDGDSTIWLSEPVSAMLLGYDLETLDLVAEIQLPQHAHGISVDFDGFVWGVSMSDTFAYKVDPAAGAVTTFSGLVGAYTYSDMTGFALSHAGAAVPEG